jgi:hypothetical protein
MPDKNSILKQKTERQKVQNSLSSGRKTCGSAILKFAEILETWKKNFLVKI